MNEKIATLVYTYGLKNGGDMAINLGAIQVLQDAGYTVHAISLFDKSHIEFKISNKYLNTYNDIKLFSSPFTLNREGNRKQKIKTTVHGILTTLGLTRASKGLIQQISQSDIVVFNGGNLLRAKGLSDYARLRALMYPLKIALKYKTPYIIFPQSASKIDIIGKLMISKYLKRSDNVFTREEISYNYLKDRFNLKNIKPSIDLAFFIQSNKKNGIKKSGIDRIAITVRAQSVGDLTEFDGNKYNSIKEHIKHTVKNLAKDKNEIYIVAQTKKDIQISRDIYSELNKDERIFYIEEQDPMNLIRFYSECNLVIGMRLHSLILSLLSGTPVVGYFDKSWGFKNPGVMDMFQMPYYYLEENSNLDQISLTAEDLLKNENMHKQKINELITLNKDQLITFIK
ncbi:polysaccharide pyruvyl transferase family protein [Virgibacillus salinus]|uniref:Polysaccharide pyruvyl transferase family protein WcaK n=1 Tax=Virgibacillus salinus TaxID=553311 RepID=A0A1H0YIL4_9BACI|nr:polysaccharide pyruvyl transferase family protein [Virgibacillus salinus]SDQ14880.1 Polysaccharide pyruvyl transferase family protein WcaK [Virgibacillus salinus]